MPQVQHNSFSEVDGLLVMPLEIESVSGAQLHGDSYIEIVDRVIMTEEGIATFMNPVSKVPCMLPRYEATKDFHLCMQQVNDRSIKVMLPSAFNAQNSFVVGDTVSIIAEEVISTVTKYPSEEQVHLPHGHGYTLVTKGPLCPAVYKANFIVTKKIETVPTSNLHNAEVIRWDYYEVACTRPENKASRFVIPSSFMCTPLNLIPFLT